MNVALGRFVHVCWSLHRAIGHPGRPIAQERAMELNFTSLTSFTSEVGCDRKPEAGMPSTTRRELRVEEVRWA